MVGGLVGALTSVPSLEGARLVAEKLSLRPQPFTSEAAFIVAIVAGTLLGMTLCLVMMHAARWIGRVVFASVMTPALGFCVHVQLMAHHGCDTNRGIADGVLAETFSELEP